jgi:hypothetical protein
MRIVGDLRWDQLTSKEEWIKRFPGCLNEGGTTWGGIFLYYDTHDTSGAEKTCKGYVVGGIYIVPADILMERNPGTASKWMTTETKFRFFGNKAHTRAFKAAIAGKYALTRDGYCSKYTCWDLEVRGKRGPREEEWVSASPTPYTISLLDRVRINTSDL